MGAKIKPSVKEYKRDARGKMTKQWTWKHYNVESISTKELKEFYSSPSYKRKKEAIRLELVKRNAV
jgi:hypothetical protein